MEPFFFGDSKQPLYGVYHPPQANAVKNQGVVLCYPFGQEYMRSHRAMRQLAMLLNKQGYHVLRFDYRGTGDSGGDVEDMVPADWIADTRAAVQELRDMADLKAISLVALRMGSLIATSACQELEDIEHLVLWDPVLSGTSYIAELKNEIEGDPAKFRYNFVADDGTLHFNGFPLSSAFQKGLEAIDLANFYPEKTGRVYQVVSHKDPVFTDLKAHWSSYKTYKYQHVPAPGDWNFVDENGGILLPQPIIQDIVTYFSNAD